MSTLFTINFRREAYLQEVARVRHRVISLGVWVTYFGMLAVLLGLYGLNCTSLAQRTRAIERQAARLRAADASHVPSQLRALDLDQIERTVLGVRRWRDRLQRLAEILPPNARITALTVNPQNLAGRVAQNALVVTGELRTPMAQDRMQAVMRIVTALRDDKAFADGYTTVRLSSTRVTEDGMAEFVIECR
jgi:hypothetical protein